MIYSYTQSTFLNNYADENTLYANGDAIYEIEKALSHNFTIIGN